MTALTEYDRLECQGVWRASPEAQRRDVIVSVGDATLVLYDKADRALGHWSLPALERVNPGETPAVYIPGPDAPEELELSDPEMIAAIEKVREAVERRRPHPGRLRLAILGAGLASVIALAVFWLPDVVVRHTAAVLPDASRADLGQRLLGHVQRVAGGPCTETTGLRALDRLHMRLLPDTPGQLVVLSGSGGPPTQHLPGGLILMGRALVEDHEDPAVAAGYILAEAGRAADHDPVVRFLDEAGALTAFRLLTTGDVSETALSRHAETLYAETPARRPDEALLARFAAAEVPSTPYAYALDISGETTLGLIEADPAPDGGRPILPDGAWVGLQGICTG